MPSVDGLVSGLDTASIIRQLISIEQRPVRLLQQKSAKIKNIQAAFTNMAARLNTLKADAQTLGKASTFDRKSVSSSNPTALTAVAGEGAPSGAFSFVVGQLATADQVVSKGFADAKTTAVGAGSFTIEIGDGHLDHKTPLSFLNAQKGVDHGKIKLTDRVGNVSIIDLSTAVTVQDVIDRINSNTTTNVTASVSGDSLKLTDNNAAPTQNLRVDEVGSNTTATDLGIKTSVAASTLTGSDVNNIAFTTSLDELNDRNGVRLGTGTDFTINIGGGPVNVDLGSAKTLADVRTAIQAAIPTMTVTISNSANALVLTDSGAGPITVTDVNGSAADLGINKAAAGAVLTGDPVIASLNTVLLKSLNGGSGVTTGAGTDFTITLSDGSGPIAVDLGSATTAQGAIDAILAAVTPTDANFVARVSDAGNSLYLKDSKGGTGNLTVTDVTGAAASLKISGAGSGAEKLGTDIDRQYIGRAVKFSRLNGGEGVFAGKMRITDRVGRAFTVDLSDNVATGNIAEAITDINGAASAASSDLTAAVNSTGDGLILTSPTGSGTLKVEEVDGGTTARDLGLLGSSTTSTLNGTFEITVTVGSTDTLEKVRDTINNLNKDVTASIVNDGSGTAPYRLNLISKKTGTAGRMLVHPGTTAFTFANTVKSRDAALLVGASDDASDPLLIVSSKNTIEDVVNDVDLSLLATGSATVTIGRDKGAVADEVNDFVVNFNSFMSFLKEQTSFDAEKLEAGVLLGQSAARTVENTLYRKLLTRIPELPSGLNRLQQAGIGTDDKGQMTFDRDKFLAKFDDDFTGLRKLFVHGADIQNNTDLSTLNDGAGVRLSSGADFRVTQRNGATFTVDLSQEKSILGVITAINNATGNTSVTASVQGDGTGLQLVDTSVGTGDLKVLSLGSSNAAADLGILKTVGNVSGSTSTTLEGAQLNFAGVFRQVSRQLDLYTRSGDGILTTSNEQFTQELEDIEGQIESLNERIAQEEERLTRKFVDLEVALGQSQNMATFLSQQLSALGAMRKS
ncbi:MAG: flagellar filament capping protein FliD [Planctomycetes bacterium]|nr:flagellar filament capping protein FliD [Planctomycetota bacterium]